MGRTRLKDIILFLTGCVLIVVASAVNWFVGSWIAALVLVVIGFILIGSGWRMHNTIHIVGNLKREQ